MAVTVTAKPEMVAVVPAAAVAEKMAALVEAATPFLYIETVAVALPVAQRIDMPPMVPAIGTANFVLMPELATTVVSPLRPTLAN